jgi:hypothetical protein
MVTAGLMWRFGWGILKLGRQDGTGTVRGRSKWKMESSLKNGGESETEGIKEKFISREIYAWRKSSVVFAVIVCAFSVRECF